MKRRLRAKTIVILVILLLFAGVFLFAASLRITGLTFQGNEKCQKEDLEASLFQKEIEKNPLVFLFQSKFKEHKVIPFVEKYEVKMLSLTEFQVTVYEKSVIGYLTYMGERMYFDKDGIVVEVTDAELPGVSLVQGIQFDHIVVNEKIPVEDSNTFNTILDITQLVDNYSIPVNSIDINSELEITLRMDKVRVELGKDDSELSEKVNDLSSIITVLEDVDGVLDMTEYSRSDKGYTFKKDESNKK